MPQRLFFVAMLTSRQIPKRTSKNILNQYQRRERVNYQPALFVLM